MNSSLSLGSLVLGIAVVLAVGCGGSTENPGTAGAGGTNATGGTAGAGGTNATGGAAGAGGTGGSANSLEGTWELSGTRYGTDKTTGLITLSAQHLAIQTQGGAVSATLKNDGSFDISVTDKSGLKPLRAVPTAAATFNLGMIPLGLSGAWSITDSPPASGKGCSALLSGDSLQGACLNSARFGWMPDFSNGSFSCKRNTSLRRTSVICGEWACSTSPKNSTCTFRFESSTITSDCKNAPGMNGTMSITFAGDLASGQTSTGFEFTASRQ